MGMGTIMVRDVQNVKREVMVLREVRSPAETRRVGIRIRYDTI